MIELRVREQLVLLCCNWRKENTEDKTGCTNMERLIKGKTEPYFENDIGQLYLGDSFQLLKRMVPESVDMIFADPPYFLSNDGVTCRSGHLVSVNKASWDEGMDFQSRHRFNRRWIRLCKRCLSPNGTIWISGTMHNIFSIGMALEQEGFKIINSITWQKTNPPPNLACRCFTHSTETIIWAKKNEKKAKHTFNYELMKQRNGGHQMKDVWTGSLTRASEKKEGKHPTQKPEYLLERIIRASTKEGMLVLDPFCGSGTTGVAARKLGRKFIGLEMQEDYIKISRRRLEKTNTSA